MAESTVIHSTFVIERTYPKPPEVVFRALADPASKRRWFAEGSSHEVEDFSTDFRVGGSEGARYRFKKGTPFEGVALASDGRYQDILPDRRVVIASTMTLGEKCISAALVTFELLPADGGTDLIFTHQGAFFEGADGPQIREGGWRYLLEQLANELARS